MIKRILIRFVNGFSFSIAITLIYQMVMMLIMGYIPMLPEYVAHFNNQVSAFATQLFLIGIMSGITSAATVVLEAKRIGFLLQSVIFIAAMLCVWIPVACFAWGFHKYVISMISTISSILVTYGICWWIRYRACRKDIEEINARLVEKKGE